MVKPSQEITSKPYIIQQWQAFGRLKPELLADSVYEEVKKHGITSLQSYVYWSAIEPVKGRLDFSAYDEVVERIVAHKLKWVPFIILGPNYSIPDWFGGSSQSVYAKCIEHGKECDIQSIWNPFLPDYVEKFIKVLAERYNKDDVIESVLIGVSGVWGEAIYPSSDGVNRKGHKHSGWWCNDFYAKQDFVTFCRKQYLRIDSLNKNWGTAYSSFDNIEWPVKRISLAKDLSFKILRKLWHELLPFAHPVSQHFDQWYDRRLLDRDIKNELGCSHYLTFVRWYTQTMTAYARKWLELAKQYFPEKPVYLVTGGYGDVITGADFTAQAKIAGELRAGIRITNLDNDYANSFANKSLLSTAAKHYGASVQTEETIETAPDEVNMRIYDHASGGITGLYFKTLFGIDYGVKVSCTKRSHNGIPLGQPSEVAENLMKGFTKFVTGIRKVETALLVGNDSIAVQPVSLTLNLALAKTLRKNIDLDIIDDNLVRDGILKQYRFLINYQNIDGNSLTQEQISAWVKSGGIYLGCGGPVGFVQDRQGYRIGIAIGNINEFAPALLPYLCNKNEQYPWRSLDLYAEPGQKIYITQVDRQLLMLNDSHKEEEIAVMYQGKLFNRYVIEPKSIIMIALEGSPHV